MASSGQRSYDMRNLLHNFADPAVYSLFSLYGKLQSISDIRRMFYTDWSSVFALICRTKHCITRLSMLPETVYARILNSRKSEGSFMEIQVGYLHRNLFILLV